MTPPLYFQSAEIALSKSRRGGQDRGCLVASYGKSMLVILHKTGLAVLLVRSAVVSFFAIKVPPFFGTSAEPEIRLLACHSGIHRPFRSRYECCLPDDVLGKGCQRTGADFLRFLRESIRALMPTAPVSLQGVSAASRAHGTDLRHGR